MSSIRECRFFHCACNPDVPANPRAGGEQRHSARRSSWRKIATHKGTAGAATLHPPQTHMLMGFEESESRQGLLALAQLAGGVRERVGIRHLDRSGVDQIDRTKKIH